MFPASPQAAGANGITETALIESGRTTKATPTRRRELESRRGVCHSRLDAEKRATQFFAPFRPPVAGGRGLPASPPHPPMQISCENVSSVKMKICNRDRDTPLSIPQPGSHFIRFEAGKIGRHDNFPQQS